MSCGFASLHSVEERERLCDSEKHQVPAGRGWDITAPAQLQSQEEGTARVTLCFPCEEVTITVVPDSSQCHCSVTACL